MNIELEHDTAVVDYINRLALSVWKHRYTVSTMNCAYCGADDWFTHDDAVLCAQCLSPETIDAGSYEDYRAKTQAEDRLKRERFTSTDTSPRIINYNTEPLSDWDFYYYPDDEGYGLAEYYDKMMDERPRPTHPPFWQLLK